MNKKLEFQIDKRNLFNQINDIDKQILQLNFKKNQLNNSIKNLNILNNNNIFEKQIFKKDEIIDFYTNDEDYKNPILNLSFKNEINNINNNFNDFNLEFKNEVILENYEISLLEKENLNNKELELLCEYFGIKTISNEQMIFHINLIKNYFSK